MIPTDMEPPAPAEPAALQPLPQPIARTIRRPSTWIPTLQVRERTWWTIALTAALLVTALGIGLLYSDDTSNQASVRSLQLRNESLTGRNQNLTDQLDKTQANLTATLGELATTKAELAHPHLVLWNVPQKIQDNRGYLAGGIPDTFTYHLQATSSAPMSVSILTLEDWINANACVTNGRGATNWCMHHSNAVWSSLDTTSVNYDFHLAEGCADYMAVFTAGTGGRAVTVTPNVSVTYNPAATATGVCA